MTSESKYSELKAAAMAATDGPWESIYDDWSDGDDALISCESRDGMVAIAKIEGGGSESGYDEPFSSEQQANTAFIAAANPAAVLELLAERDADKKRIAKLETSETQLIQERDSAEAALADMYEAAIGERPEWSNWFGFSDAVEKVSQTASVSKQKKDEK